MLSLLTPDWPAPSRVKALTTTRQGGVSVGPYAGLNLGEHVEDDPHHVAANRRLLREHLPDEPWWLTQTHSTRVLEAGAEGIDGDGSFTSSIQTVCAVMTADCLPILICDVAGTQVAAVHAGWRGLAGGIVEQAIARFDAPTTALLVWLGPAIGAQAFEVGEDVRECFVSDAPDDGSAFRVSGERYLADLYALARHRLRRAGVTRVYGGDYCTFSQPELFYSYRRDGQTGRMASMIWLDP